MLLPLNMFIRLTLEEDLEIIDLEKSIIKVQHKHLKLMNHWRKSKQVTNQRASHMQKLIACKNGLQYAIPLEDSIKREILNIYHDSKAAGHLGRDQTFKNVTRWYWWPGMQEWIALYVKGCAAFQQNKVLTHRTNVPLYRINVPPEAQPFQVIAMDLITQLPKCDGHDAILTSGRSRMLSSGSLHPMLYDYHGRRYRQTIFRTHLSMVQTAGMNDLGQRPMIHISLRQSTLQSTRDQTEYFHCIPSSDRWTDRAKEPVDRTIPTLPHHASTGQLGTLAPYCYGSTQQRKECHHQSHTFGSHIGISPLSQLLITVRLIEPTSRNQKGNGNSETGTSEDGIKQIGKSHPKKSIQCW